MAESKEFWQTLEDLRVKVRLAYPVKVRRRKLREGLYGECRMKRNKKKEPYFDIRISDFSGATREELVNTLQEWILLHEWAHAATWGMDATPIEDSHGPMWGLGMSKCEREVYGKDD